MPNRSLLKIRRFLALSCIAKEFAKHLSKKYNIKLICEDTEILIEVEDNGIGLPDKNRNRLIEPYVTTRTGGTGLGLAIVSKIMKDHNGHFSLTDNPLGGTVAILKFFKKLQDNSDIT